MLAQKGRIISKMVARNDDVGVYPRREVETTRRKEPAEDYCQAWMGVAGGVWLGKNYGGCNAHTRARRTHYV